MDCILQSMAYSFTHMHEPIVVNTPTAYSFKSLLNLEKYNLYDINIQTEARVDVLPPNTSVIDILSIPPREQFGNKVVGNTHDYYSRVRYSIDIKVPVMYLYSVDVVLLDVHVFVSYDNPADPLACNDDIGLKLFRKQVITTSHSK